MLDAARTLDADRWTLGMHWQRLLPLRRRTLLLIDLQPAASPESATFQRNRDSSCCCVRELLLLPRAAAAASEPGSSVAGCTVVDSGLQQQRYVCLLLRFRSRRTTLLLPSSSSPALVSFTSQPLLACDVPGCTRMLILLFSDEPTPTPHCFGVPVFGNRKTGPPFVLSGCSAEPSATSLASSNGLPSRRMISFCGRRRERWVGSPSQLRSSSAILPAGALESSRFTAISPLYILLRSSRAHLFWNASRDFSAAIAPQSATSVLDPYQDQPLAGFSVRWNASRDLLLKISLATGEGAGELASREGAGESERWRRRLGRVLARVRCRVAGENAGEGESGEGAGEGVGRCRLGDGLW